MQFRNRLVIAAAVVAMVAAFPASAKRVTGSSDWQVSKIDACQQARRSIEMEAESGEVAKGGWRPLEVKSYGTCGCEDKLDHDVRVHRCVVDGEIGPKDK